MLDGLAEHNISHLHLTGQSNSNGPTTSTGQSDRDGKYYVQPVHQAWYLILTSQSTHHGDNKVTGHSVWDSMQASLGGPSYMGNCQVGWLVWDGTKSLKGVQGIGIGCCIYDVGALEEAMRKKDQHALGYLSYINLTGQVSTNPQSMGMEYLLGNITVLPRSMPPPSRNIRTHWQHTSTPFSPNTR